ncbi:MAG: SDR family oxidoreductase [bacterium]
MISTNIFETTSGEAPSRADKGISHAMIFRVKTAMDTTGHKRAALVTGGAIRLGKAISLALAKNGFDIALHYNTSQQQAEETAGEIRRCGVQCALFQLDLANTKAIAGFLARIYRAFPKLCVLINNASLFKSSTILETPTPLFDKIFAINFRAPFFLSKEFAKHCDTGQVINILDTKVFTNDYDYAAYYLSKKALAELTKTAALEFAPKIRVNAIAPGPTIPTAGTGMLAFDDATVQAIPLKRTGTVKNVTDAILHLIQNTFINGHILTIDGGESLGTAYS